MIPLIVLGGTAAFVVAFFTYGKYLGGIFGIDPGRPTPAHTMQDGRDYYPARTSVLVGHHFSSIAGAGPIVGPILATLAFGWLPSVLWIVLGSIFIGAVHDYGALVVSIRHRAMSIAQVVREHMSVAANKLFLTFIWLTLVYVLVVFLDLTAVTFAPRGLEGASAAEQLRRGGGVASSSVLFILLALGLGLAIYRFKVRLMHASLIFVPLLFGAIWVGQQLPILPGWLPLIKGSSTTSWALVLLVYCLLASVLPVWVLLQPRDYLSSFLLYACLGMGLAGIIFSLFAGSGAPSIQYPAFLGFHHARLGYLFPALFITIACGACSGFHSVVASGTTAKQLDCEQDARTVGYGSMLLEGVLGLLAVITVAIALPGSAELRQHPTAVFAGGLSRFLVLLGVPAETGTSFGLLALSTFLLTTLDTGTRLGRYIFEELLELKHRLSRWIATVATLALPLIFSLTTFHDPDTGKVIPIYKLIWPVFGATNQLLGGLALLAVSVWLRRTGKNAAVTLIPMVFMISVTLLALVQLVLKHGLTLVGTIGAALLVLAVLLLMEAVRALMGPK